MLKYPIVGSVLGMMMMAGGLPAASAGGGVAAGAVDGKVAGPAWIQRDELPAEPHRPAPPPGFAGCLDASRGHVAFPANPAYVTPPLTVECWARLPDARGFNILAAAEPKRSATHWELYTFDGTGRLAAYLPGYVPGEIVSSAVVTDGQWHWVAMTFDGATVCLFADGREVARQGVRRSGLLPAVAGALCIGGIAEETSLGCRGLIGEVRLSKIVRTPPAVPRQPLAPDADTLGLWHLENVVATPPPSLDEVDFASFRAGPAPMDQPPQTVALLPGPGRPAAGPPALSLGGDWQMAENGAEAVRLAAEAWPDAIPAPVPGSVHGALQAAGKIPDPKVGRNDEVARGKSYQTWWFRRTFKRPPGLRDARLVFAGVAIHCTVWLNGTKLGGHEGMFGGPEFVVEPLLRDDNVLVVKLDPAPQAPPFFAANDNSGWRRTVVFNNVWGWHYSNIPALGIWREVRLEGAPAVKLDHPFIATADAQAGVMDLAVDLAGPAAGWRAEVGGTITPDNFAGAPLHFSQVVTSAAARTTLRLRFTIPQPRLWWPNDLGAQPLYRLALTLKPAGGGVADAWHGTFGIRTLKMAPLPGGPKPGLFNWTFVVNGRPVFIKGSGWCTMDSSMDFSRARYDRLLSLARQQHVQMLRGWGSGMPETDEFYDLCDRYGILVMQEWPTAWNSHHEQPYDALEETVRLNTVRLRNHPSLAMWGGGNESDQPYGKAIDMMGRHAIELDGTRPFHRGEPFGGSQHNYDCWWGRQPLDRNLSLTASFFGEFGIASVPVLESVQRYLPPAERELWPPPADGSFAHHTPVFNTKEDLSRLQQYAGGFTAGRTLREFIRGSELAQAVALRHPLELARTRWPECAGALYYKMNDNYPAASWATVDWYGAPKIAHYFCRDAFAPLHACVLFPSLNLQGRAVALPVFLLDDAGALQGDAAWQVTVRAFDARLRLIKREEVCGEGASGPVKALGTFTLTAEQAAAAPLLVVAEVSRAGVVADRTFYFVNYEAVKDSLFQLPRTTLSLRTESGRAVVRNDGTVPAVGVAVSRPGGLDTFSAEANYFWLDPGEVRTVAVNRTDGLAVDAFNTVEKKAGP